MTLEIKKLNLSLKEALDNSDLKPEIKEKLVKSKLVLLPASFSISHKRGAFPSETSNFLKYIQLKKPDLTVSLFENPGQVKVQALHAADIVIPAIYFLSQDLTIQIIVNLVSSYLYDKLKGNPDADNQNVDTEYYVEDKVLGRIKYYRYKGPLSGMKNISELDNSDNTPEEENV